MATKLSLPDAVKLYREISGTRGFLTYAFIELYEFSSVLAHELRVLKFRGNDMLVLEIELNDSIFYVDVRDIDGETGAPGLRWERYHRSRNPLADEAQEQIARAIRRYMSPQLKLVG